MYNGYRQQISNAQLATQRATLERVNGRRRAAKALGLAPDRSDQVPAVMRGRLIVALQQLDSYPDDQGDNGVEPVATTPPRPYLDDTPLEF